MGGTKIIDLLIFFNNCEFDSEFRWVKLSKPKSAQNIWMF